MRWRTDVSPRTAREKRTGRRPIHGEEVPPEERDRRHWLNDGLPGLLSAVRKTTKTLRGQESIGYVFDMRWTCTIWGFTAKFGNLSQVWVQSLTYPFSTLRIYSNRK